MTDTSAVSAIQNKLSGKRLNYHQIFSIMDEISHHRLGTVLTTYFAASGYAQGFSNEELYFLTEAMIKTGETLKFKGLVADKHSIGGVPGTRTTMIVTPIVASAGFTIPKSSSRAITTPGGTADDMEVISPVTFNKQQIYKIVEKTNACIVWGGGVDIAPADDELIKVEEPLGLESFDKILVSIMAKKIAFGSNHIIIDLPYGEHVKVHNLRDAEEVKRKFEYLADKFNVKIKILIHDTEQPAGRGIGPLLEARDAIMVLEQNPNRPIDLEQKALHLAGSLLDLCLKDSAESLKNKIRDEFGSGRKWAEYILSSGHAHLKMKEIIKAQGGKSDIMSEDLKPGRFHYSVVSKKNAVVKKINSRSVTVIAKILGAPTQKKSGIYLDKKIGESTIVSDPIYTLYSEKDYNLSEAIESLKHFPILEY
ncbi:MAG TPA: thymidine phosphorylase [Candidatus Saccharimonadales bacterium]|nr:thymidine phosphorylase [Candidatus Saccharimonadales bacterium]